MHARLGINNCFALKRWPRPDDWAQVVRDDLDLTLVELSLDLVEGLDAPAERARSVEETRAALQKHGLHAETTFTGLAAYGLNLLMHPDATRRDAALRWYRGVVDVTAQLGAGATGGHVGTMSVPDWTDPSRRSERCSDLLRALIELSGHARDAGLEHLLVENLVSLREPSTMDAVEELLTEGDGAHVPVRLCLDVGHQCVPGTEGDERDPYAWLRHFGGRLAEVQLQQSDALGDHHWPFTPERNAQGRIEPDRVLDTLAASGAEEVLLVLEIIPGWEEDDAQVVEGLRASVQLWKAALRERGLL
ncbi:MAG: sugar phosphate isomerase/epimerase family protein [Candidatus Dormibacteria bacterium]